MSRSLYIALLLLAGACKVPASVAPTAAAGETLALFYRQPSAVARAAGGVQLEFAEVQDSRCPSGSQCIWAGEARVTLLLTADATATQTLHLGLNPGPLTSVSLLDSLSVTLHQRPYWVRLLSVTPYPALGSSQAPRVATVRLRAQ